MKLAGAAIVLVLALVVFYLLRRHRAAELLNDPLQRIRSLGGI